jgi:hypothetical protein
MRIYCCRNHARTRDNKGWIINLRGDRLGLNRLVRDGFWWCPFNLFYFELRWR